MSGRAAEEKFNVYEGIRCSVEVEYIVETRLVERFDFTNKNNNKWTALCGRIISSDERLQEGGLE